MHASSLLAYLTVVLMVTLAPGADFTLVLRNAIGGGLRRGLWTSAGVGTASATQGALTAIGVGAVIVRVQPLFLAIKWAGIAYLCWLGISALRAAWQGRYGDQLDHGSRPGHGFRQGFVCNITNPKMLVFYLALLPQFVAPGAGVLTWLAYAWMLPLIGTAWLAVVCLLVDKIREVLVRRSVRRSMDAATGAILVGFGVRLALEE